MCKTRSFRCSNLDKRTLKKHGNRAYKTIRVAPPVAALAAQLIAGSDLAGDDLDGALFEDEEMTPPTKNSQIKKAPMPKPPKQDLQEFV